MRLMRLHQARLVFALAMLGTGAVLNGAVSLPVKHKFECDVALMTPQRQLTAPSPVSISFDVVGKTIHDIRVIDAGGILFPGGNMKVVKTAEAIRLESVLFPSERPGQWSGKVEKSLYRLRLNANGQHAAVEIGLGRKPAAKMGRFGLIWNASHQPEGIPKPISGTGVGNCALRESRTQ
jgi:hypothetical protein